MGAMGAESARCGEVIAALLGCLRDNGADRPHFARFRFAFIGCANGRD
jgi:hypothetical protein